MGFKAITINTPSTEPAHIYSSDDAALYNSIVGVDCILDIGNKMEASIISNNLIRVSDGACIIQGRFGRIPYGEYEEMIIENGSAGQKRNDIIVARFTTTSSGEIETYELVVIKGVSGTVATDPEVTVGDLNLGEYIREMPLYRVMIDGLSIIAIETMYQIVPAINKLSHPETHPAGIITTGEFSATGVRAKDGTDYTTSRIRNAKFSTTVPTSLNNGEICFVYE